MQCRVMLCCEACPATDVHSVLRCKATKLRMHISSATSARNIWLPDDGLRTETCRSVFNVLMCKFYQFYICAVVGVIIE